MGNCLRKKGPGREIKMSELAKHNRRSDAWLALDGKVFDVTEFASRHPGGYDKIEQGFGKDATEMFKQVHPDVDYETILAGKQVGVLKV